MLALFEQHLAWAEGVALKVRRSLPPSFDVDDLKQEARIGLWRSVEAYDPSRGVPFRAFAMIRVRGAVLMASRRRAYKEATHEELNDRHVDRKRRPDELLLAREERRNVTGPREYRRRVKMLAALERIPDESARLIRAVYLENLEMDQLALLAPETRKQLRSAVRDLKAAVMTPLDELAAPESAQRVA